MVSVERVLNYSELEPEAALETPKDRKPPADWPATGHIVFRDVTLRYDPDPTPALDHISFEIRPKEKVRCSSVSWGPNDIQSDDWRW